jgi:hypothetical protein
MEANYIQKRMEEIQKSGEFANAMGKLLSGKPGYKAVVEKKRIEDSVKFCPGCGSKVEMPKKA